jgi:hypothetical protein
LQQTGNVATVLLELRDVGGAGRIGNQLLREFDMPPLQRIDGRHEIVGTFRQGHERQQRIGDASTGRQDDGLPRVSGRFDDLGNAAETSRIGDAGTTEFMYYPFIHNSEKSPPRRAGGQPATLIGRP